MTRTKRTTRKKRVRSAKMATSLTMMMTKKKRKKKTRSNGLPPPGVQLRIRRAGDKKFRWESYTNSRGEFAVRVPQGAAYEMVIRAKGFTEQTRTIDAKSSGNEESIAFRLEPALGGKK